MDERPREKLLAKGAAALSDAELLAILLRTGTAGHSALDLARAVLKNFQSLRKLIASDQQRFCAEPGLGPARFAELQAAAEIARRQLSETLRAGPSLSSPRATRDFLTAKLRDLEHEVFCCLYLDLCAAPSYVEQEGDLLRIAAFRLCPATHYFDRD
ncbi:MAG: repair protein RadC [Gammaproteobacteria bacterium]|nr:repair protein RadC [Gammaproteobacteria bacterium]